VNLAKTVNQLGSTYSYVTSELDGNPPLWITHRRGPYHDDHYINNARILLNQSNFKSKNAAHTEDQVLHKIDEVLVPVCSPKSSADRLFNPNAWDFIAKFESFNFKTYRIRTFRQRINQTYKADIFRNEGGHTFFIPIDDGFKDSKPESVDGKVIDGHVIPRKVLFTEPTQKDNMFETLAESDNIRVFITFSQDTESKSKTIYIKSHTMVSEGNITKGVVMAAIKEANIPVKNGVIHLIHKPLMIVDHSVKQFLEEKEDGPLSRFYQEIVDSGDVGNEFMQTIQRAHSVTLFAPRNAAWDDGNLKNLLRDKSKFRDLLNMHLVVEDKLYMDKIRENNIKQVYQAPTLNKKKNLYFNVAEFGNNRTLTVEGGGVNATVIQPDIAAKNGIIHITDRVLGVPYTTVLDKLRTDPMLNDTYHLGQNCGFNRQFNDTTRRYTFFVPRDRAWQQARVTMPSAIKKLFMLDFCYFAVQVLERHLIVGDVPLTMEKIKAMANDTTISYGKEIYTNKKEVELETVRDNLKIAVEERVNSSFIIHWKGKKIHVFRPNVECTNGVIHVINYPFLEEGDIRISASSPLSLTPHLLMLTLAKWLLL
ncbi:hypothetical protein AMK59_6714, partial [Oryctes borbonicus]